MKSPPASTIRHSDTRELNVLFVSVGCTSWTVTDVVLPRLSDCSDVSITAVVDTDIFPDGSYRPAPLCAIYPNAAWPDGTRRSSETPADSDVTFEPESAAASLCEWADLMVLAPLDANHLAKMLHGHTDDLLLKLIRGWSISKKILLVPGMSTSMWENPMTKKQLAKIRRKWNWVQVLQPILWTFQGDEREIVSLDVQEDVVDIVRNQVLLMNIGQDVQVSPSAQALAGHHSKRPTQLLPPELWTMIVDFTGDWELAKMLHVHTNLPVPDDWKEHAKVQDSNRYMKTLEWTILQGSVAEVKQFTDTHGVPRWLSKLCVKLIMRFAMVPLLTHFETNHKDLFWSMFGHTFLPDKASKVFGRPEILEFWRTSPSFLNKEYTDEAIDGASGSGFVNVLKWWEQSRSHAEVHRSSPRAGEQPRTPLRPRMVEKYESLQ